MSKITIANIAALSVPTPPNGQLTIFADATNSDHLSIKTDAGLVFDLLDGSNTDLATVLLAGNSAGVSNIDLNGNVLLLSDVFGDVQSIDASTGDIVLNSDAYTVWIKANAGLRVDNGLRMNGGSSDIEWAGSPTSTRLISLGDPTNSIGWRVGFSIFGDLSADTLTASRTWTMPDASGTIALTSNIQEWSTYTGTRSGGDLYVTLGDYDNTNNGIRIEIDDAAESISLFSSDIIYLGNSIQIQGGTAIASITANDLTTNRTFSLPNASGTIALTTDLSAYLPLVGATLATDMIIDADSNVFILSNATHYSVSSGGDTNLTMNAGGIDLGFGFGLSLVQSGIGGTTVFNDPNGYGSLSFTSTVTELTFFDGSLQASAGALLLTPPTGRALDYAADYSANYNNRSLVDKEYVDSHLPLSGGIMSGNIQFEQQLGITNEDEDYGLIVGLNSPVSTDKLLVLGDIYDFAAPPVTGTVNNIAVGFNALGQPDIAIAHQNFDLDIVSSVSVDDVITIRRQDTATDVITNAFQLSTNVNITSIKTVGVSDGNINIKTEDTDGYYVETVFEAENGIFTNISDSVDIVNVLSLTLGGAGIEGIREDSGDIYTGVNTIGSDGALITTSISGAGPANDLASTFRSSGYDHLIQNQDFTTDNNGTVYHTAGVTQIRQQNDSTGFSSEINVEINVIYFILNPDTSLFAVQGLPIYADNAAALSGGLYADCIYKTATGEVRIVV